MPKTDATQALGQIAGRKAPPEILHPFVKVLILVRLLLDEQDTPAGPQNAMKLRQRRLRMPQVVNHKHGNRQIGAAVGERKRRKTALAE